MPVAVEEALQLRQAEVLVEAVAQELVECLKGTEDLLLVILGLAGVVLALVHQLLQALLAVLVEAVQLL
jgi:hypothetical protein